MKRAILPSLLSLSFSLAALPAAAQQGHHHAGPPPAGHAAQPYAGQQARSIKALSEDEVKQYLAGGGLGFARPAELNRHPGPLHALELADRLELTDTQRAAIRKLMDEHKAEARAIGAKLVEAEREIEHLFRAGDVSPQALAGAVAAAAELQGAYRLSHLETHRRLRPLLTEEQVARYDALRGYQ
ncbi:MAG TPA: Spy/CpxP family protein refolding chaperone [Burkholderiales bacterium]|nr:Spy/CpxP family protein refolding chaperone [Burkholderiales bacterium]